MAKLNIYDLYRKTYPANLLQENTSDDARLGETIIGGEKRSYIRGMKMSEYTPWAINTFEDDSEPILGDYLTDYMNQAEVRAAFNIPDDVQTWSQCTRKITYHELDECSLWIYPILKNHIKIMKYSGDTDGAVPTYGTKQWIKGLNWDVEEEWRPWFTENQVSGYVEKYDGLDFVTVKGVGHMAPQWARQAVQEMILSWVHDEAF